MLDMQENALEKDGKAEPCILLSQEEYFIVSLMSSLNEIGNTNDPSGGSFESNSLATILLNSVHDMILFLVASDSAKRKPFRNFMVKLFFFIEDFAINQILVEGMTSPELSLGQVVGGSSSHLPNFMMFRLYTSLIRGNQELYRSYYLKSRRYGRIGSSSYKGTIFTNFVYRTHEFCTNCMSKWRRDHRVSILELGEVIIYLLDPINMIRKHGNIIMRFDEGEFDAKIDEGRVDDKEILIAKRNFIENYLKDFSAVFCHLLACFIITFSDLADIASERDIQALVRLLEFFEPIIDKFGKKRIFYGSVMFDSFESSLEAATKDLKFLDSKKIDSFRVAYWRSKQTKSAAFDLMRVLQFRNSSYSKQGSDLIAKVFSFQSNEYNDFLQNKKHATEISKRNPTWDNEFIVKAQPSWYDPIKSHESALLFYSLALPAGYASDFIRFYVLREDRPSQRERQRYVNSILYKDKELGRTWAPVTDTRFLSRPDFVCVWLILFVLVFVVGVLAWLVSAL